MVWFDSSEGGALYRLDGERKGVTGRTVSVAVQAPKGQGEGGMSIRELRRSSGAWWLGRGCAVSCWRRACPCRLTWRTVACAASASEATGGQRRLNGGVLGVSRVEGSVQTSGGSRRWSGLARTGGVRGRRHADRGSGRITEMEEECAHQLGQGTVGFRSLRQSKVT